MNPNIKKISEDLVSTNFAWMDAGFIKELGVMDKQPNIQQGDNDVLRITYDGRFILNSAADSELYVRYIQAVMHLKDVDLNTTKGFYKVMRSMLPQLFKKKSDAVICFELKKQKTFEANVTLFEVISEWEQARRQVKKNYKKQNSLGLLSKIF